MLTRTHNLAGICIGTVGKPHCQRAGRLRQSRHNFVAAALTSGIVLVHWLTDSGAHRHPSNPCSIFCWLALRRAAAARPTESAASAYVEATRSGCFPNGGVTCVVAADCIATTPHVAHPRQTHAGDDSRSRSGLVFGRSLGDSVPCAHPRLEGACVCDGCRGRGGGSPSPSEPPRPPALAAGGSAPGGGAEGAMGLPPARAPLAGAAPAGPACSRSPSRRGRRTC